MAELKKDQKPKKTRSKRLLPDQVAELIIIWSQFTRDELAAKFSISKGLLDKIAIEIRELHPELCPSKKYSLKDAVAEGVKIAISKMGQI
jgi:hypothetical protein